MDIIQKLSKCDLGREVYHSDGEGHIQVQQLPVNIVDTFETPQSLLTQVEQEELWLEFFEMVKAKEDEWILHFTRYFPDNECYSTTCFVEFLSILSSRDAQIQLIQGAPLWTWDEKNGSLISTVIDKAAQLADSLPSEPMSSEIELAILNRVINRLEAKRNKTK